MFSVFVICCYYRRMWIFACIQIVQLEWFTKKPSWVGSVLLCKCSLFGIVHPLLEICMSLCLILFWSPQSEKAFASCRFPLFVFAGWSLWTRSHHCKVQATAKQSWRGKSPSPHRFVCVCVAKGSYFRPEARFFLKPFNHVHKRLGQICVP